VSAGARLRLYEAGGAGVDGSEATATEVGAEAEVVMAAAVTGAGAGTIAGAEAEADKEAEAAAEAVAVAVVAASSRACTSAAVGATRTVSDRRVAVRGRRSPTLKPCAARFRTSAPITSSSIYNQQTNKQIGSDETAGGGKSEPRAAHFFDRVPQIVIEMAFKQQNRARRTEQRRTRLSQALRLQRLIKGEHHTSAERYDRYERRVQRPVFVRHYTLPRRIPSQRNHQHNNRITSQKLDTQSKLKGYRFSST
jgi:hypothetical protein